jgi:hypothetical protein
MKWTLSIAEAILAATYFTLVLIAGILFVATLEFGKIEQHEEK